MNSDKGQNLYQYVEERAITKDELGFFSNTGAHELLVNVSNRIHAQGDISTQQAEVTEVLSANEIFKNVKNTLKSKKWLDGKVQDIENTIEKIRKMEEQKGGIYGFFLSEHLPKIEEKFNTLKGEIDIAYKESNTHTKLSKDEEEKIGKKRKDIVYKLDKFIEDLKEYL